MFSFRPRTSIIGLTNFFILNVIANVIDSVINSFTIFQRNDSPQNGPNRVYGAVTNFRWILAGLLPSVNLKHALSNSQLHENQQCIRTFNALIGTKFPLNEPFASLTKPGVGGQILIFCIQMTFWTIVLIIIEKRAGKQPCCGSQSSSYNAQASAQWNDSVRDDSLHRREGTKPVCSRFRG